MPTAAKTNPPCTHPNATQRPQDLVGQLHCPDCGSIVIDPTSIFRGISPRSPTTVKWSPPQNSGSWNIDKKICGHRRLEGQDPNKKIYRCLDCGAELDLRDTSFTQISRTEIELHIASTTQALVQPLEKDVSELKKSVSLLIATVLSLAEKEDKS